MMKKQRYLHNNIKTKLLTICIVISMLSGMFIFIPSVRPDPLDPWWNVNWKYRKEININYNLVQNDLTNFPFLINLASDTDLAGHTQTNGNDIVFTDSNKNILNHEIESYNKTTGSLTAWIKIPFLSSTTNTKIYMYYGNSTCGNTQNITNVWDSNFKIVQHLKEKTGLHYDSTNNDNDGTTGVTTQGSAIGKIDGTDQFDGLNDYIDYGYKNSLNISSAITIESWVYNQGLGSYYPRIVDKYPAPSIYIRETSDTVSWYSTIGGVSRDITFSNTIIPQNTWTYVVVTYANDANHAIKTYINGQLKDTIASYSGIIGSSTTHLIIGNRQDLQRAFNGRIDEVRISDNVRDSGWIKTCYNNQNNPSGFYVIGNEETSPVFNSPPVLSQENPTNNTVDIDIFRSSISIKINDLQGDQFNWTIEGKYIIPSSGHSDTNGVKSASLRTPLPFNTNIVWYVNTTDHYGSNNWTKAKYTFCTYARTLPVLKWSKSVPVGDCTVPALVADVNNDGKMEIIRKGASGIIALDGATGATIWYNPTPLYSAHGSMEILDLNKDGIPELLAATQDGGLSAFHANNGTLFWHNSEVSACDKYIAAGDIDADGFPEIFCCVNGYPGYVFKLSHDGRLLFTVATGYPCWGGLTLGDPDHDGIFDLFQADYSASGLRCWNPYNMTLKWMTKDTFTGSYLSGESHCAALVDVNNDGREEAVYCDQYKNYWSGVAVINCSTGKPITIPTRKNILSWSGGDVDGDNVTYDVYFGTSSTPPKVSNNQQGTTYDLSKLGYTLDYNKRYYWKIVARDSSNLETSSGTSAWYFNTHAAYNTQYVTNLLPANKATSISTTPILSWTGGDSDPESLNLTYDVYFGTSSSPPKVSGNQTAMTYTPGILNYDTTYYWRINAWSYNTYKTTGTTWYFTTHKSTNDPPYTPSNPIPASGTTPLIKINPTLSWSGGDVDGDTVTYDVYFGLYPALPKVSNNQSTTTYTLGTLTYNKRYNWKIVAWDNHSTSSTSAIWTFYTETSGNDAPYAPFSPYPAHQTSGVSKNGAWSADIYGMQVHSQFTVFDIDNDGHQEIITGGHPYGGHGGADRFKQPTIYDLSTWSYEKGGVLDQYGRLPFKCFEPPGVADIDGDGQVEIIQCNSNNVTLYSNSYEYLGTLPISALAYFTAQDIDNDGHEELIFSAGSNVVVYDTTGITPTPHVQTQFTFYSQDKTRAPVYTSYGPYVPIVKNENPMDGAKNRTINSPLSVYLYQYQNNLMNITFKTNASTGIWYDIGNLQFVPSDHTYTINPTDMNLENTRYWWSVNARDTISGKWTNKTFSFTTLNPLFTPWWNNSWRFRKAIVIDHTKVPTNLTNFPVLIKLLANSNFASHTQPDGDDIVFTDKDGKKLKNEIESYNSTNGSLITWVNITHLSSRVDTIIYLYYGNSLTGNNQNIINVWDTHFKIIQHLKEKTGTHYDSTRYQNNGTPQVIVQGSAIGVIDGSDELNGIGNYIDCGNKASLNLNSMITIESWVYNNGLGSSFPRIVDKYPAPSIYIREATDQLSWYGEIGGVSQDITFTNTIIPHNTWTYIVVTYANNASHAIKTYLNGQLKETITTYSGALSTTTTHLVIGNRVNLQRGFDGKIDEIRISDSIRNSSWISTCYNNQNNPSSFYIISAEEALHTFSITNINPFDGSTNIPTTPLLQAIISSVVINPVSWSIRSNVSGTWMNIAQGSLPTGSGVISGTSIYINQYEKTYYWSINATDGIIWTNGTYHFTTVTGRPIITNSSPSNEATYINLTPTFHAIVSDLQGDSINWWIRCYISDSWINVTNGTIPTGFGEISGICTDINNYHTIYSWSINTTDTIFWTNETYSFTTKPYIQGVLEDFDTDYVVGQTVGSNPDWYDGGTGPIITSDIGLIGSIGLASANNTFIWKAHPFTWEDPALEKIIIQMDFETNQLSLFDNNRIGWMISDSNISTDNFFGVQLTNNGTGNRIEGYWDHNIGIDKDKRPNIINLPDLISDSWYRFHLEVTKLTAISAKINVTLSALDPTGYPIGTIASGAITDTSALGTNAPDIDYFTKPIWPAFNNNQKADNANFYSYPSLPYYKLSTNSTPVNAGWVISTPPGGTYEYGTVVTLNADPDTHWHFTRWDGNVPIGHEYDNPLSITMYDNKNITTIFTVNSYTISTSIVGSGTLMMDPSGGLYEYNTLVNITAVPGTGWAFAGWSGSIPAGHEYDNPVSITMDENKTIVVIFKQPNPEIIEILQNINESLYLGYLEDIVEFGPRMTGSPACHDAETYLYNTFHNMSNITVQYKPWNYGGYTDRNVEATLPGTNLTSNQIYLICAHIDSIPTSPGADDDGSGVAVILTAADILSQHRFNHTIRFVAFSGEENNCLGSTVYAAAAKANGDNIIAVMNTDTIGHIENASDYNKLKIWDNPTSVWLTSYMDMIKNMYNDTIQLKLIMQHFEAYNTDVIPFWDRGYSGFHSVEPYVNYSIIHCQNDTIEHMNISYCLKTTRLEIAALIEFAELVDQ